MTLTIKSRAVIAWGPNQSLAIEEVDVMPAQKGEVRVRVVATPTPLLCPVMIPPVPACVSASGDDNIIYDQGNAFTHPECGGNERAIAQALPLSHPVGE